MHSWRAAQLEDESFLFTLFAETRASEFAPLGLNEAQLGPLLEMQYRGRKMTYAANYPHAEDLILIAADGLAAGRLLVDRNPERVRIVDVAVLRKYRGSRIATRAIEWCQAQCRDTGARLELQVSFGNPARKLYERLGFRVKEQNEVSVEMAWDSGQGRCAAA